MLRDGVLLYFSSKILEYESDLPLHVLQGIVSSYVVALCTAFTLIGSWLFDVMIYC
jgi:hypothetical protein